MKQIKKHAPQLLSLRFWLHALVTSLFFIFVPIGAKIIFHGNVDSVVVVDVLAGTYDICSYRISTSGMVHGITSPYYNQIKHKTTWCLPEAKIIANAIK